MNIKECIERVKNEKGAALFYTPAFYKNSISYFFNNPIEEIKTNSKEELEILFRKLEEAKSKNNIALGYLNYESAYLFDEKIKPFQNNLGNFEPLSENPQGAKFYIFNKKDVFKIKSSILDFNSYFEPSSKEISNFKLNEDKKVYIEKVNKILNHISEGDIYQLNYTLKSNYNYSGDIWSLFTKLLFMQTAKYIALINEDEEYILSFSPELFFSRKNKLIECKPMKGTIKRGYNIKKDETNRQNLENSIKDRAENVMIVDLLRNDLSKLDTVEKVWVSKLFEIEKYETLYQMTSTIKARTKEIIPLENIFKALFPCGSITGAPKIRATEIIKDFEREERGIYTGALGIISPEIDIFNVAIRTIILNKKNNKAEMGLGSGIVWDSKPEEEYKEVLIKGNFINKSEKFFNLIETMLIENNIPFLLPEHLERLKQSADFFLFLYEEKSIIKYINTCISKLKSTVKYRLHIELNKWGKLTNHITKLDILPKQITIKISDKTINSTDKFQYFKTTNRELYDKEYEKNNKKGIFETVFFNERGELTEGSRTNIFIKKQNLWLTPKLECGLLNGTYRQVFISKHPDCIESIINKEELLNSEKILLANSVRKEIIVNRIEN